jgi:hypothetical protein
MRLSTLKGGSDSKVHAVGKSESQKILENA